MALEALNELYREVLLDHFKNPRNHSPLPHHDVEQEGFNPLCGDHITLQLEIDHDKIKSIGCWGKGCSISQASGSILTEIIKNKSFKEVEEDVGFFKMLMQGKASTDDKDLGDVEALSGVQKFPVRIKCALLSWTTLEEAIEFYRKTRS